MELTEKTILELLDRSDEVGYVSIFVGITPDRAAEHEPGWPIEIRNQLRDLRQRAREREPHDRWVALDERIEALNGDLERLLDASRFGRGRALFAAVDGGDVETVSLQIPFRDRVVFDRTAYIRPLVAALEEGRPAGIVVLHKRGTRLLEWRMGAAEELEVEEFSIGGRDWRHKSGPAPAQPQDTRAGGTKRDHFEDRIDDNRARFMREQARAVADIANERGWDRLIIDGDPRLANQFAEDLNPVGYEQLRLTDLSWEGDAPNSIADAAWETFKELRRDRGLRFVEEVKDRTLSGGAGALGLSDVLATLNEGRVERLLFDQDVSYAGYVSDDDLLFADDARPTARGTREEPLLVERMIERALATGATVTPLDGEPAMALREHGGVAAILRW